MPRATRKYSDYTIGTRYAACFPSSTMLGGTGKFDPCWRGALDHDNHAVSLYMNTLNFPEV
jgi:hypothetical protein